MNGMINYIFENLNNSERNMKTLRKVVASHNRSIGLLGWSTVITAGVLWIQDREIKHLRGEIKALKNDIRETKRTMEGD